jgi:hypothetical protein
MRHMKGSVVRTAIGGVLAAVALAALGLLAFPAAAVAGGAAFLALGAGLAYDVSGLGARWIEWKRSLGGPALPLSAWLDRTVDGAAVAWLGIAVAWVGAAAVV